MLVPSKLESLILNSDYEDLRDLVYYLVGKFSRRYAIPIDDLLGPANAIYVREYHRWDSERGTARSSWLYSKIWYGLMSFTRRDIIRRNRFGEGTELLVECSDEEGEQLEIPGIPASSPNNYRLEIESELSESARAVVQMLLDARNDLALTFAFHTHTSKRIRREHMRRALREHLIDLGWPKSKIRRTFSEIQGVLSDGENFWKRE